MTTFNFKSVRHTVFDAYGTLFDVHSAASRYKERLGQHAQAVSTIWRTKQLEYTWLRSLMNCYVDFWEITQDALDYSLECQGINDNSLRKDLLNAYFELSCYPEVQDTLSKIKQMGLGTAILSNGSPKMLEAGVTKSNIVKVMDSIISVDTINPVDCAGNQTGSIFVSVAGLATPFSYTWSGSITPDATHVNNEDLETWFFGTYSLIVVDTNGCQDNLTNVVISQPQQLFGTSTIISLSTIVLSNIFELIFSSSVCGVFAITIFLTFSFLIISFSNFLVSILLLIDKELLNNFFSISSEFNFGNS